MITRRGFLAAGLASVAFLSACGSSSKSSDNAASEATVDLEPTVVTLTSAGSDPKPVAYKLSGSHEGSMEILQGFGQASGAVGSSGLSPQLTSTTLTLPYTADDTRITFGTPKGSNDQLNGDIATAKGFSVSTDSNAQGIRTKATYKAPDGATATARSSMESAVGQFLNTPVAFPTQPIGVGAVWQVRIKVNEPSPAVRTITYTLDKREGDVLSLKASVEQRPSVTSLSLSDAPGSSASASSGASASSSDSASSSGTLDVKDTHTETAVGTVTVDLTSMVPTAGKIDQTTTVTYASGDTQVIQQNRRSIAWS